MGSIWTLWGRRSAGPALHPSNATDVVGASNPRRYKYSIFEVSGSKNDTLDGIWESNIGDLDPLGNFLGS